MRLARTLFRRTPLSVAFIVILSVSAFAIVAAPLLPKANASTQSAVSPVAGPGNLAECPSQTGTDLSTGTNGEGMQDGTPPVTETSWYFVSGPGGTGTTPAAATSTAAYGIGNLGGRIQWISYPGDSENSPGGVYNYTVLFSADNELPGTFKLYNFSADNSVELTLTGPAPSKTVLGQWKSGSYPSGSFSQPTDFKTWWSPPSADVAPTTGTTVSVTAAGTYTLTATVDNGDPSLTALAVYAVFCQPNSPTLTTNLSASAIMASGYITDSATLAGASANAGGTVTYRIYPGICTNCGPGGTYLDLGTQPGSNDCASGFSLITVNVVDGVVPDLPSRLYFSEPAVYSIEAYYSGDANNSAATSPCEIVNVMGSPGLFTTLLPGSNVFAGTKVTDSAILVNATSNAGGRVQYERFNGASCSGHATNVGPSVTVTNGVVPDSGGITYTATGTYSWEAVYTGDANNAAATSPCETLTVLPTPASVFQVKFVCNSASTTTNASSIGLEPGYYDTLINIHNPSFSASSLTIVEKFVLSTPQNASLGSTPASQDVPANPTPYVDREVTLGPDAAVQINCAQILAYLGVNGSAADGFVVIYSPQKTTSAANADVWVGYSAADSSYNVASIQMTQVTSTAYVK